MELKDVILLVWDDDQNFKLVETKRQFGDGKLYRDVKPFQSREEFQILLESLDENDQVVVCCHVKYKDFSGVLDFRNSGIKDYYHLPEVVYLSSADSGTIMQRLYDRYKISLKIILYNELIKDLKLEEIKPIKVKDILSPKLSSNLRTDVEDVILPPQIDYAIITALEEKEMEKMLLFIENEGTVKHGKHLIEYGHIKGKPNKKVAYASQLATGMIDAAVLSTELIYLFKPKFLIMAGVLGGKPKDVKIGDIIVATKIFTIDKGKLTDDGFQKESEQSAIENVFVSKIIRNKKKVLAFLAENDPTRDIVPDLHFGPIACVRKVVDVKGFFNSQITPVDRKAVALEMESYGVARACELANGGSTTPIIIKSVMDNTTKKTDGAKSYAAWTSAAVVNCILANDII